jgi:hypothetical protein
MKYIVFGLQFYTWRSLRHTWWCGSAVVQYGAPEPPRLISVYNGRHDNPEDSLTLAVADLSLDTTCSKMRDGNILCCWMPRHVEMIIRRVSKYHVLVSTYQRRGKVDWFEAYLY